MEWIFCVEAVSLRREEGFVEGIVVLKRVTRSVTRNGRSELFRGSVSGSEEAGEEGVGDAETWQVGIRDRKREARPCKGGLVGRMGGRLCVGRVECKTVGVSAVSELRSIGRVHRGGEASGGMDMAMR